MTRSPSYLAHWYYHLPDLILAVLVWLLVARLVLDLLPGRGSDNLLVRVVVGAEAPGGPHHHERQRNRLVRLYRLEQRNRHHSGHGKRRW